jgi:cell division protein FtsI (penicillin-binding protein 3)
VFKAVTTYALQELKIPPTGAKPPKVTLHVTPDEALSDPTVLRNGHKRSGR